MSLHEEMTDVTRSDVPRGYLVRYHELRGYDSPDRWYSAVTKRGRAIGEFATYGEAVKACLADWRKQKRR